MQRLLSGKWRLGERFDPEHIGVALKRNPEISKGYAQ
jgi:hypothetical protein